jgi:pimeloyl-ACP methyl ester carboxylesterase
VSKINVNGIEIEFETFGDKSLRPLLLNAGHGSQMILWDDDFCNDLVNYGHFVIRYDYRDVGYSTKFDGAHVPNKKDVLNILQGKIIEPLYTLDDMADDAVCLLDALNIQKAHICGISMGGMIAQSIAINHTDRILSLISISSTSGNPALPLPAPEIMNLYVASPPDEREAYIDHMIGVYKAIRGGFIFDEIWTRKYISESYDRCYYPQGKARHTVAVLAHGNRAPSLSTVSVPTLVIHGKDDPFFLVAAGLDTANAISGAKLLIIDSMGHDLPHGEPWPQIIQAIANHTANASNS